MIILLGSLYYHIFSRKTQ